eukprot:12431437-Karenia_brevis.AAC.1
MDARANKDRQEHGVRSDNRTFHASHGQQERRDGEFLSQSRGRSRSPKWFEAGYAASQHSSTKGKARGRIDSQPKGKGKGKRNFERQIWEDLGPRITDLMTGATEEFQRRIQKMEDDLVDNFKSAQASNMLEFAQQRIELKKMKTKTNNLVAHLAAAKKMRIKKEVHSEPDVNSESEEPDNAGKQQATGAEVVGHPLNAGRGLHGGEACQFHNNQDYDSDSEGTNCARPQKAKGHQISQQVLNERRGMNGGETGHVHSEQDCQSESDEPDIARRQQAQGPQLLGEPLHEGRWLNGGDDRDSASESEELDNAGTQRSKAAELSGELLTERNWLNGGEADRDDEYCAFSSGFDHNGVPTKCAGIAGDMARGEFQHFAYRVGFLRNQISRPDTRRDFAPSDFAPDADESDFESSELSESITPTDAGSNRRQAVQACVVNGADADSSASPDQLLQVKFKGLVARGDLNGAQATVLGFDMETGRYQCVLDRDELVMNVKPENMEWISSQNSVQEPAGDTPLPLKTKISQ